VSDATTRLVVSCPDRPGVVATLSRVLHEAGANIVRSAQYSTDPWDGTFFMRLEFALPAGARPALERRLADEVAPALALSWRLWDGARRKRIAVLVSRYDHALRELLYRGQRDELDGEIVLVASNHEDLRGPVEAAGLPYHHVPVEPGAKPASEAALLELVAGAGCDLVVLARYMQILSGDFLEQVGVPVINIHHSFLPAFAGAGPYERARERGVKLIGATAHYVTEELDAGPIIEQDVTRVTHADDVEAMVRAGADIECAVLARAVRWHCEDRVLRHGATTIVF
jgi:formyltetrahydrofolate deformylase